MLVEDLIGAYALDAIDDDERRLVDQHLSTCATCREELAEYYEVVASLAGPPIQPPDRVWERILSETSATSPTGTSATSPPERLAPVVSLRPRERRFVINPTQWLVAAAAAVAVVALSATTIVQSGRIGSLTDEVTAQQQEIASLDATLQTDPLQRAVATALEDPDALIANLTADDTDAGLQVVLLPDGTGFVHSNTLATLPADATYQLWAVVDDRVISAGVLGNDPDVIAFHVDPNGLQGLVITEEIAGGVAQSESDPVVAWFEA